MDDIGHPTQLLYRFKHATGKEDGTFAVVGILLTVLILCHETLHEIVVVVDEIDLETSLRYGCDLDDQRMVCVVDNEIHSRETDYLMQLSTSLVDIAPLGHKCPYFVACFLHFVWQVAAHN